MAASAVIGSLRVDLGLNSASFQNGLASAQKSLSSVSKAMSGLSRTMAAGLGGFAAGAVSAISLGAAISKTNEALATFGDIADAAKASGVSTDLFQGLTTLAAQSGVAVNEVAGALSTFAKNSGLAAVNKGKLYSTLKSLNPELLRNLQLTTDQGERVRLAADAIAAAGSASERAALSTALFGNAGAKMAAVFEGGSRALDAWLAKARDMGLIVDRDVIAKADEMGDAFDTAAQALDVQLKSAFVELAPIMVAAAGLASDVAKAIGSITDSIKALSDRSRDALESQREDIMSLLASAGSMSDMNGNPMAVALPDEQVEALKAQLGEIDAELRRRALDDLRLRLLELPKTVEEVSSSTLPTIDLAPLDLGIANTTSALDDMEDVAAQLGDTLAGAFSNMVDAVLSGENALKALGNELASIGKQLLSSAISNFFGGLFGGGNLFGGIGGSSIRMPALYADAASA
jgi:hypothetical protein